MPKQRPETHDFKGEGLKCAIKLCGLGKTAWCHRKPKDFPDKRLEAAEAIVKRMSRVLSFVEERCAMLEDCVRDIMPTIGASISQRDATDAAKIKVFARLDAFTRKWEAKTKR